MSFANVTAPDCKAALSLMNDVVTSASANTVQVTVLVSHEEPWKWSWRTCLLFFMCHMWTNSPHENQSYRPVLYFQKLPSGREVWGWVLRVCCLSFQCSVKWCGWGGKVKGKLQERKISPNNPEELCNSQDWMDRKKVTHLWPNLANFLPKFLFSCAIFLFVLFGFMGQICKHASESQNNIHQ